ncbi:MAG: hypothetical protein ACOC3V_03825 [bacterium]
MKLDTFIITLEKNHPNGRFIHTIREKGYSVIENINLYFEYKNDSLLWVANEKLRTLNKVLNSNYTLSDFEELSNNDIVDKINKFHDY